MRAHNNIKADKDDAVYLSVTLYARPGPKGGHELFAIFDVFLLFNFVHHFLHQLRELLVASSNSNAFVQ